MLGRLTGALAAGSCLMAVAVAAPAQAQVMAYDIPAGSLQSALDAFARQSGRQVIYRSDDIRNARSRGARGPLAADAALASILAGTGFAARTDSSGAIAIVLSGEIGAGSAAADDGSADAGATSEILVVGSRTQNVDIRRSEDGAQPYVNFTRQDIERSGARDVNEFLGQRLPSANATNSVTGQSNGSEAVFGSQIALRGLPSNQTLILIDGRRIPDIAQNGFLRQPDISALPVAAIERIEVLPATASGIYGGSAVGGVINLILRRDYEGLDVRATLRDTTDFAAREWRLDLAGGLSLEDGRTSIIFSAMVSGGTDLLAGERDLSQRARALALRNNPNGVIGGATPPLGATANIRSVSGATLTLRPEFGGGSVGSAITSVPVGYAGPGSDNGAGLIARGGQFNLDLANSAQAVGALQNFVATPSTLYGNLVARREFTDWLSLYVDVAGSRSETVQQRNDVSSTFVLNAGAAGNPFQQQVRVTAPAVGVDTAFIAEVETWRATGGAIIDLPFDWRGTADYTWSKAMLETTSPRTAAARLATDVSSGVVNIFQAPANFAAQLPTYLNPAGASLGNDTRFQNAALRLSGPVGLILPGGRVTASLLGEWRETRLGDYLRLNNGVPSSIIPSQRQRVTSLYGELFAPVVSPENGVPFVHLLELQAAVRWDRYNTLGATSIPVDSNGNPTAPIRRSTNVVESVDPTFGARWKPIEDLAFRISYGTGFLPPSVEQLVGSSSFFSAAIAPLLQVRDPLRGNEAVGGVNGVTVFSGGQPTLRPERSTSLSVGAVLTPRFLPSFRASIDWIRIRKRDAISALGYSQETLTRLLAFAPDRIVRDTSGNNGPYAVGAIVSVDTSRINATQQEIEAFDLALDYRFAIEPLGTFNISSNATYTPTYLIQLAPPLPYEDRSGTNAGTLKWRVNGQLTWQRGGWTVSWSVRYFDHYFINTNRSVDLNLGAARIRSQTYHDLYVSYEFGARPGSPLSGMQLQAGVNNIFDSSPPLNPTGAALGLPYSTFGDARGASFYLGLRKSF